MLVISRRKGESLMIGEDVEITVVKLDDGSVKLAINAPKNITILRSELYNAIKEENKSATNLSFDVLKSFNK